MTGYATIKGFSKMRSTDPLGNGPNGILPKIRKFQAADLAALKQAAATATEVSRKGYKRQREIAPPRPGRSGQGKMTSFIRWSRIGDESAVALRIKDLDNAAPHWIIQEIGTGQKADIKRAGPKGPTVTRVATIKSQKGRAIPFGLVFASQGRYVPARSGGGGTQNLFPRASTKGAPRGMAHAARAIRITKEIEGQHFIQKGATQGFREYETSVLSAARRTLRKSSR